MEKILRVNDQKSANGLLIEACNKFRDMNVPTIQAITLTEEGQVAYRSKGGLIGIYTEKALDAIIAELEALRPHVKKYEASQKKQEKEEKASEKVDSKALEKALQTLIAIGHTEEEAKKILKLQEKEKDDDLPEDLKVTLKVLLDRGIPREEAYKKLGLTKAGKVDKRRKG